MSGGDQAGGRAPARAPRGPSSAGALAFAAYAARHGDDATRARIVAAVRKAGGNVTHAAQSLGLTPRVLHRWIARTRARAAIDAACPDRTRADPAVCARRRMMPATDDAGDARNAGDVEPSDSDSHSPPDVQ